MTCEPYSKRWEESKHPRDKGGQFSSKGAATFGGPQPGGPPAEKGYTDEPERQLRPSGLEGLRQTFRPRQKRGRGVLPSQTTLKKLNRHWKKKATEGELSALRRYTGMDYYHVNLEMRKCPETLDCLGEERLKIASEMLSLAEKADGLKAPVTVWRGVSLDTIEDMQQLIEGCRNAMETGGEVAFNGFASTSFSAGVASEFSSKGLDAPELPPIMFEIVAKSGMVMDEELAVDPTELELIQAHGTKYKVTGIEGHIGVEGPMGTVPVTLIQLEEIADE